MANKIYTNHTLEEYNKKYGNKHLKKVNKVDVAKNKSLLNGHSWWLIKDTYYQLPDKKGFAAWWHNLGKGARIAICCLAGAAVVTAAVVPSVMILNNNTPKSSNNNAVIDGNDEVKNNITVSKGTVIDDGTQYTITSKSSKEIDTFTVKMGNDTLRKVETFTAGKTDEYRIVESKTNDTYEFKIVISKETIEAHINIEVKITITLKEPAREVTKEEWVAAADALYASFNSSTNVYDKTDISNVQIGDITSETSEITGVEYGERFGGRAFRIEFSATSAFFAGKTASSGQGLKDYLSSETEGGHFIINSDGSLEYRTDTIPSGKLKWYREVKINPYDYVTFMDEVRSGTEDFIYKATYNGAPHAPRKIADVSYSDLQGQLLMEKELNITIAGTSTKTISQASSKITIEYTNLDRADKKFNLGVYNGDGTLLEELGEQTFTASDDPIEMTFTEWGQVTSGDELSVKIVEEQEKTAIIDYSKLQQHFSDKGITILGTSTTSISKTSADIMLNYTNTGTSKTFNIGVHKADGTLIQGFGERTFEDEPLQLTFTNWNDISSGDTLYFDIVQKTEIDAIDMYDYDTGAVYSGDIHMKVGDKLKIKILGNNTAQTNVSKDCTFSEEECYSVTLKDNEYFEVEGLKEDSSKSLSFMYGQCETTKSIIIEAKQETDKEKFVKIADEWVSGTNGFVNATTEYTLDKVTMKINGSDVALKTSKYSQSENYRAFLVADKENPQEHEYYTVASSNYNGTTFKTYLKEASATVTYTFDDDYIKYEDTTAAYNELNELTFNKYGYILCRDINGSGRLEVAFSGDPVEPTEKKIIDVEWDEDLGYYTGLEYSFSQNEEFEATMVGNDEDEYGTVTFRDADGDKLPVSYQGSITGGVVVDKIVDNDGNTLVKDEDFAFNSSTYEFSFTGYKDRAEITFKCKATAALDCIEVRGTPEATAKVVTLSATAITPEGYSVSNIPASVIQGGDDLTFTVTNDTGEATDNTIEIYEKDRYTYLYSIDVTLEDGDNDIEIPNSALWWDDAREDVEYVIEVCEPEEPATSKTVFIEDSYLEEALEDEGIILEACSYSTCEDDSGEIVLTYINETPFATFTIIATNEDGTTIQTFGDISFDNTSEPKTVSIYFNNWGQVDDEDTIYLKISQ